MDPSLGSIFAFLLLSIVLFYSDTIILC